MLVLDDSTKARHAEQARYEIQREEYKQWVAEQFSYAVLVDGTTANVAEAERQCGRVYMPDVFEEKCRRLIPSLWCCVNPHNPAMRAMYAAPPPRDANGNFQLTDLIIGNYPNGPLPEWSILSIKRELVPDPSIWGPEGKKNPIDNATDGWVEVKSPGEEVYRGWRTILALMVARRHAAPEAIEREFGIGDRLSWATHMGRREGSLL